MNFQITPFPASGKIALFSKHQEDVWRLNSPRSAADSFFQREVVSVLSTENGHFLLVLQGEELVTIRDVCRSEHCDFVGVYERHEMDAVLMEKESERHRPGERNLGFASVLFSAEIGASP